jgi:hypothetical protein
MVAIGEQQFGDDIATRGIADIQSGCHDRAK